MAYAGIRSTGLPALSALLDVQRIKIKARWVIVDFTNSPATGFLKKTVLITIFLSW
jgi:hypothetical protein